MKKPYLSFLVFLIIVVSANAQSLQFIPRAFDHQHASEVTRCSRAALDDFYKHSKRSSPAPQGFDANTLKLPPGKNCTFTTLAELAALDAGELVDYLTSTSDPVCHYFILFQYDEYYSPLVFSDEKIQAVAGALNALAPDYDGTHATGIYGLIAYLRPATYYESWAMVSINQDSWDAIIAAMNSLSVNPHLLDLNAEAAQILSEFIILLDLPGVRSQPNTIAFIKQVMHNMVVEKVYESTPDIGYVIPYWSIFYLKWRGIGDPDYIDAIAADEDYMNLWGMICVDEDLIGHPDLDFVWNNNAILIMAQIAYVPVITEVACHWLAMVCDLFPRLHPRWIHSIIAINENGMCEEYDLCEDIDDIIQELKTMLFPNRYSYNDGTFITKAKFDRKTADELYYATRIVESRFFRLAQTDQPIPGDPNDTLLCIVFESKLAYDLYAPLLYGIPTNNGGIYIESRGEFYTWDRPASHGLSLEELFRHEFVHYLQGRFLIHGFWGASPIYANSRLTWYEEGNAELLTSATDFYGIKLRPYLLHTVASDYPNWPTLEDIFTLTYQSSQFLVYHYSNLLWYNWYVNDYGLIKAFFDLTIADDIEGFDNLVNLLQNDPAAQAQWESFLMDVYNGVYPAEGIHTSWLDDVNLTVGTIEDIHHEFTEISGMSDVTVAADADSLIQRFRISGTLEGHGTAFDNSDAAQSISQALDSLMLLLKADLYINNFNYTVGYFTDVAFDKNTPQGTFNILGSLRHRDIDDQVQAEFVTPYNYNLVGNQLRFYSKSSGYIKSFDWSFQGGSPSASNDPNPSVVYGEVGYYPVSLTVGGKHETSDTMLKEDYVRIYAPTISDRYCSATHGNDFMWISKVALNKINNPKDHFPAGGFADFSQTIITPLHANTEYPITVDLTYVNSSNINVAVWIDFNQNGIFEEDELVLLERLNQNEQLTSASIFIPELAINGVTRMRVRVNFAGDHGIAACGPDYLGQAEDYSVVIKGGVTVPFTASFSSKRYSLINAPVHFLSHSNVHAIGNEWSFPGGTPPHSTDMSPSVVYEEEGIFPVQLTTTWADGSTHTKHVPNYMHIFSPTTADNYCIATYGYEFMWITDFKLNEISNTNHAFPPDGYNDHSQSISTPLLKGQEYPITIDLNYLNSPNINVAVWIDLNQDGEFQEEERLLFARLDQNEQLAGASIIIPADAACGVTRLRVRVNYLGDAGIEPCGHDDYLGYAEDYSVIIFETLPDPLHLEITGVIEESECVHGLESVTIYNASISGNNNASVRSGGYIAISDFELTGSAALSVTAATQITIQAPASIMPAADGYFHARIDVFEPCQLPVALVAATEKTDDAPLNSAPLNAVTVDSPVSFFRIYPNPAKSQFKLELTGDGDSSTITVEIINIMGKRISHQVLTRQSHYLVDLSGTPAGIYLVRVRSSGSVGQERLIISR